MQIYFERDSVSAGDDCKAPNPAKSNFRKNSDVNSLMAYCMNYLPIVKDSLWVVFNRVTGVIGFIICDDENNTHIFTEYNKPVEEVVPDKMIKCSYFYGYSKNKKKIKEKLFDKVKKYYDL